MRNWLLAISLFIEALAQGQGFNKRYDAFGWGFAQTGFGIEVVENVYVTFSVSEDYDSIAPGLWEFHASVLLTWLDESGTKLSEKRSWRPQHSAFAGWANCCDTIPGGGFVVGGSSEDSTGYDEVFLMRFDAEGDTLWTRVFSGPTQVHYMIGRQVKRTPDGGFLIVGDTGFGDILQNGIDGFVIKTDSLGNEQWRRNYGGPPPEWEALISGDIGPAHTYYLAGSTFPTPDNGQRWVMRVDTLGEVIWSVDWGGPFSEGATQLITGSDGQPIIFSGHGYATSYALMRPYIAKLDSSDGSLLWERTYGALYPNTIFFSGKEIFNGDLIAAGGTYISQSPNTEKGLLARTTNDGDSIWMFTYFYQDDVISTGQGRFYDVLPTPDGGFIAAGVTRNPVGGPYPPGYSQDTWVVKVDGIGCIVPGCNSVGIAEQATNLLDALSIYPNPAHGQVTMELTLPPSVAHLPLQLSLVGMDGRIARQRTLDGNGAHTLALDGLAAGVYYVHVASEGKWLTGGKLIVQ